MINSKKKKFIIWSLCLKNCDDLKFLQLISLLPYNIPR